MDRWRLEEVAALDLLKTIPTGAVDALITDPPYGTTAAEWDVDALTPAWWVEAQRVVRLEGAVVVFACGQFTRRVLSTAPMPYRYKWVWVRGEVPTGHLDANRRPMRLHEDVLVFGGQMPAYSPVRIAARRTVVKRMRETPSSLYKAKPREGAREYVSDSRLPTDVVVEDAPSRGERDHPTQKPVRLMRLLVESYSRLEGLVVDCFAGSGSTGVACMESGRRFAGSETNAEFAAVARRRIGEAATSLFERPAPVRIEEAPRLFDQEGLHDGHA